MVKNLSAMQETGVRSLVQEGNGNPHQYSGLENSMDQRSWQATDHNFTKSQTLSACHVRESASLPIKINF